MLRMNVRITVNLRSRGLKNFCFQTLCKAQHIDRAMNAGLGRLHRIPLVMNRRCGTSEVVDFVDLDIKRECDIVAHQLEKLVIEKMFDIFASAGKKIIDAQNICAFREQPLTKMRAEKTRPTGHQNS